MEPIGWMQFNNPARHNAVSVDMWKSVPEIMTEFENDNQIRVVVLSGAGGKAFISGADISEFEEKRSSRENILEYNRIAGQANAAIIDFPKPTIAMIQGYCIGGGSGRGAMLRSSPGRGKCQLCGPRRQTWSWLCL
jgi:enoyl-CoA hydratase/carnithine racemase